MSWADLETPGVRGEPSPIESDSLGTSVGRIAVPRSSTDDPDAVVDLISDLNTELTIVRAPAEWSKLGPQLALTLPDHLIMHVDTLVYWSLVVAERAFEPPPDIRVNSAPATDAIGDLVRGIFSGYRNHYASNPSLRAIPVEVAYADWATRHSISGDPIIALEMETGLIAIATCSIGADHLEILLAGVAPDHQGRGIYPILLAAVETLAVQDGVDAVMISTQAHNVAVQRSWARYGFMPIAAFNTFHVMKRTSFSHVEA